MAEFRSNKQIREYLETKCEEDVMHLKVAVKHWEDDVFSFEEYIGDFLYEHGWDILHLMDDEFIPTDDEVEQFVDILHSIYYTNQAH